MGLCPTTPKTAGLRPAPHKPFEKGLTPNFIFHRAFARWVTGQGLKALAGDWGQRPQGLSALEPIYFGYAVE